jgi:hypothetical protein
MIPEEEIYYNIAEMGYITVKQRHLYPSFYKLADGTILKVDLVLNYLTPNPVQQNNWNINSTNIVSSFVPKEKRKPEAFKPYSQSDISKRVEDEDVEFDVLQENFSVYDLSNGFVMSIKPVLAQVRRTGFYSREGEPVYTVNVNPIIKAKKR